MPPPNSATLALTIPFSSLTDDARKARRVTARELETVQIKRWDFHGEWNYTISQNSE